MRAARGIRVRQGVVVVGLFALFGACAPAPPGEGGIVGSAVGVDDTGLPDWPMDSGVILVFPGDRVEALLAEVSVDGPQALDGSALQHLGLTLDQALLDAHGGTRAEITEHGKFRVHAPAGPALVCLSPSTDEPWGTRGCDLAELPETGELRVSWGEGGVRVIAR